MSPEKNRRKSCCGCRNLILMKSPTFSQPLWKMISSMSSSGFHNRTVLSIMTWLLHRKRCWGNVRGKKCVTGNIIATTVTKTRSHTRPRTDFSSTWFHTVFLTSPCPEWTQCTNIHNYSLMHHHIMVRLHWDARQLTWSWSSTADMNILATLLCAKWERSYCVKEMNRHNLLSGWSLLSSELGFKSL